jgi:hypothetical protein
MKFDFENKKLGIFFSERAVKNSRYTLKKSKTKNISLAVYKDKIVGMELDALKVTNYKTISNFLTKQLHLGAREAESIMDQIVGLSGHSRFELSGTLH